nr:FAD-dependent monooxygenase [Streptomyces sp. PSAA01]
MDATVVGAGPVGLVLAAELALAGARVQILERLAEPSEAMKAGAINVPTAEALDRRARWRDAARATFSQRGGGFTGLGP